jgi:hypothetical protein
MVPQRSGQTNVVQYLTGNLRAGDYVLTIEQPQLASIQPARCYPFVWDILLRSADVTNIVESVEPSSGVQLNPQQELNIRVTLSEAPYKGSKKVDLYVTSLSLSLSTSLRALRCCAVQAAHHEHPLSQPSTHEQGPPQRHP